MSIYLDASVLVSLNIEDRHTRRAMALRSREPTLFVSRWTFVEFSSAVAAAIRRGDLRSEKGEAAERRVETWSSRRSPTIVVILDEDLAAARAAIRKVRAPLRGGDALHIAIALRTGHDLATFDDDQARAAKELGLPLVDL